MHRRCPHHFIFKYYICARERCAFSVGAAKIVIIQWSQQCADENKIKCNQIKNTSIYKIATCACAPLLLYLNFSKVYAVQISKELGARIYANVLYNKDGQIEIKSANEHTHQTSKYIIMSNIELKRFFFSTHYTFLVR